MKDRSFNPGIEGTWVGILGLEGYQLTKYRKKNNAQCSIQNFGGEVWGHTFKLGSYENLPSLWWVHHFVEVLFASDLGATWLRCDLLLCLGPENPARLVLLIFRALTTPTKKWPTKNVTNIYKTLITCDMVCAFQMCSLKTTFDRFCPVETNTSPAVKLWGNLCPVAPMSPRHT